MPTTPDFTPSLKKIERAERKFGNLVAILQDWASSQPVSIHEIHHGDMVHIVSRVDKDLPDDTAWEIVEIVGHLRAALDKMTVALVEANGVGVSGVSFPFGGISNGKADEFPSRRHEDVLKKKLTPDQWQVIIRQQPHPAGNVILWAVNEVANEDKHRKDLVSVHVAVQSGSLTITGVDFASGGGTGIVAGSDEFDYVLRDKERERVLLSMGTGVSGGSVKHVPTVSIVFNRIPFVAGRDAITTVGEQIRLVKGIVHLVAETFG